MQVRTMVLNAVSVLLLTSGLSPFSAIGAPETAGHLVAQAPQQSAPQPAQPEQPQQANPFKNASAPPAPGFPGKGDIKTWTRATRPFNEAIDLSSSKKYKEAVAKYQEAIKIYPYAPTFYANMAFALERGGDPAAGVAACKKAVELDKTFAGAYENLGNCLYDLGKYSESRDAFNQALRCELPMRKRDELIQVVNKLSEIMKGQKTQ